ncbi:hypothetical protein [Caballeronia sp. INDeC2]|uniref:hypothetical protein n=1 Tax=Caballeronia sp. INDeC2 TaxID=2921747 RepID=UPI002029450D|nr:hypothetical protein [Caballeronia sp. INDeC2]
MSIAQASRLYDFMTDLAAARQERADLEFEDAKEAAAREVTFDDVIEELTDLDSRKKAYLMHALDKDRTHFAYQLEGVFTDAIEKIAKRRAWEQISKPRGR